jgi:NIMA (never in mitosis gene a)-related kinase
MQNFEKIQKIGQGSYSEVYKVLRKSDNQIYAMKKVKMGQLSQKEKQNALNEVRILASLASEYIISYKEAFINEEEHQHYLNIIMEYANGGDL